MADSAMTFCPTGIGRYFSVAFFVVWLAGWAVGEIVALGALVAIAVAAFMRLRGEDVPGIFEWGSTIGTPLLVVLFLLVWVTFWTIGGVAAMTHVLRTLAGKDRVRLVPEGLELMRCAGPFRRIRLIDRAEIRRVRVRHHDAALVADTVSGTRVLTELGTRSERETICRWLRDKLQLPAADAVPIDPLKPPPGWVIETSEEGSTRLRRQSSWLPWARREWLVRRGGLTSRWRFGLWVRNDHYDHGQFGIESSTDGDGDNLYRLFLRSGRGTRTIQTAVNDDGEIVDCARWLAARTGFPFESRRY